jgi:hypothetical protein
MVFKDKYLNTNRDVAGYDELTKFDVFMQNHRYVDNFTSGYAFIFVTKPMLFLYPMKPQGLKISTTEKLAYENMTRDHTFTQFISGEAMNDNDLILAKQLSYYGEFTDTNNFLPIFTNRLRSFQTMDVTLAQTESYDTRHGYRMPLPTHKIDSVGSNSLSIVCTETLNLDFIKMMTLWVNYISNVTDGTFHANPNMIRNNVIDYMSSIFYFVLEPDGRTVKYWAKYTGAWPTTIPHSPLSFSRGDSSTVELDLNFTYTSKEDMNPSILEDFNRISLNYFEEIYSDQLALDVLDDDYPSIKNSPLLSPNALKANINFNNANRGPLVFVKTGSLEETPFVTPQNNKFELSFGENTFENMYLENKFESEYFFENAKKFFESQLTKK